ncbi:hypothetical protein [Tranquillimonas alkanivorans]|uniref:Uncharacterized protein n=1 Tax=Tranquillimonas alkanivorans TaxID=441119 RepID=A0A1I5L2L4_9RHOB|nr:hypothetical protein [Tranquillimonas alkanivorans]SFO91428.1 hypothetical protein SAMN04488047_101428 [Tranquillimonas alkanivorans]
METQKPFADTFRTRQAAHDLRHHAEGFGAPVLDRIAGLIPLGLRDGADRALALREAVAAGCDLSTPRGYEVRDHLRLAAVLPDDDFDAFLLAGCMLLADVLRRDAPSDDLPHMWEATAPHYRLAPPPLCAALANGFAQLEARAPGLLDPPPTSADRLTRAPDVVVPPLLDLARTLPAAARRSLGLEPVLGPQSGLFRGTDTRAVRAVTAAETLDEALPQITALVCLNAILRTLPRETAAALWAERAPHLLSLPAPERAPILAGVRLLFESDDGFLAARALPDDRLIPVG